MCICYGGNEPVVIPNAEGKRTTPSVIAFVEEEIKVETLLKDKQLLILQRQLPL